MVNGLLLQEEEEEGMTGGGTEVEAEGSPEVKVEGGTFAEDGKDIRGLGP